MGKLPSIYPLKNTGEKRKAGREGRKKKGKEKKEKRKKGKKGGKRGKEGKKKEKRGREGEGGKIEGENDSHCRSFRFPKATGRSFFSCKFYCAAEGGLIFFARAVPAAILCGWKGRPGAPEFTLITFPGYYGLCKNVIDNNGLSRLNYTFPSPLIPSCKAYHRFRIILKSVIYS